VTRVPRRTSIEALRRCVRGCRRSTVEVRKYQNGAADAGDKRCGVQEASAPAPAAVRDADVAVLPAGHVHAQDLAAEVPSTASPLDSARAADRLLSPSGATARDVSPRRYYAALDLGTNNCRLLVAQPTRRGFKVKTSFSRIIRLGEGLSTSGRLSNAAI